MAIKTKLNSLDEYIGEMQTTVNGETLRVNKVITKIDGVKRIVWRRILQPSGAWADGAHVFIDDTKRRIVYINHTTLNPRVVKETSVDLINLVFANHVLYAYSRGGVYISRDLYKWEYHSLRFANKTTSTAMYYTHVTHGGVCFFDNSFWIPATYRAHDTPTDIYGQYMFLVKSVDGYNFSALGLLGSNISNNSLRSPQIYGRGITMLKNQQSTKCLVSYEWTSWGKGYASQTYSEVLDQAAFKSFTIEDGEIGSSSTLTNSVMLALQHTVKEDEILTSSNASYYVHKCILNSNGTVSITTAYDSNLNYYIRPIQIANGKAYYAYYASNKYGTSLRVVKTGGSSATVQLGGRYVASARVEDRYIYVYTSNGLQIIDTIDDSISETITPTYIQAEGLEGSMSQTWSS